MIKKLPVLSSLAILLVSAGCDKETAVEPAKPANTPATPETTDTPKKGVIDTELADPADVDAALHSLNLTKEQNEKIKAWVKEKGAKIDPTAMASFISSILNDDQQRAFRELTQLPNNAEAGDDGDDPQ